MPIGGIVRDVNRVSLIDYRMLIDGIALAVNHGRLPEQMIPVAEMAQGVSRDHQLFLMCRLLLLNTLRPQDNKRVNPKHISSHRWQHS